MSDKINCLLCIIVSKWSGHRIGELKKRNYYTQKTWKELPKYSLVSENGSIRSTEKYHQFTVDGKEFNHILFDVVHADMALQEEIDNSGLDELFNEYDLRPLFYLLPAYSEEEAFHFRSAIPLIVELEYVGGYYEGIYELDRVEKTIIGYLDANYNKIDYVLKLKEEPAPEQ